MAQDITFKVGEPTLGRVSTTTVLSTGVKIRKDKNGNIVRLITPQRNTLPLNSTIGDIFFISVNQLIK